MDKAIQLRSVQLFSALENGARLLPAQGMQSRAGRLYSLLEHCVARPWRRPAACHGQLSHTVENSGEPADIKRLGKVMIEPRQLRVDTVAFLRISCHGDQQR
jgi:hypothetical protein